LSAAIADSRYARADAFFARADDHAFGRGGGDDDDEEEEDRRGLSGRTMSLSSSETTERSRRRPV